MPAVFVHGVPETSAIWGPLIAALDRDDILTLSPPGFGAPVPDGFVPERLAYVDWLISQLEAIDGPIDLIGHDWGGGHVLGVVMARPDLVRSWASDVLGLFHPEYVWHDMAQAWQTQGIGEDVVAGMVGVGADDKIALLESLGIHGETAEHVARAMDDEMGRCILGLYRSATREALDAAAPRLANAKQAPGLAMIAGEDPYLGEHRLGTEMAETAGASVAHLDGLGHWWMLQDPEAGASILMSFWAGIGS